MSKATHTPGPWGACKDGDCSCGQIWSRTADHPIAVVESGPWGDTWPALRPIEHNGQHGVAVEAYIERMDYGEVCPEAAQANARLIAAAPDLLEALEAIVGNESFSSIVRLKNARAAISKARGE